MTKEQVQRFKELADQYLRHEASSIKQAGEVMHEFADAIETLMGYDRPMLSEADLREVEVIRNEYVELSATTSGGGNFQHSCQHMALTALPRMLQLFDHAYANLCAKERAACWFSREVSRKNGVINELEEQMRSE